MKIGFVPKNKALLNNELFRFEEYDPTQIYGMDRPGFSALREHLATDGHLVGTVDTFDKTALDCVVFIDSFAHYPDFVHLEDRPTLVYMMREPPSTVSRNGYRNLIGNSIYFDSVITWNDAIVDSAERFKKYSIPQYDERPQTEISMPSERDLDTLLTNISSRKFSSHPNELYSERRSIIEFYEQNHPEKFDLYGYGWNERPSLADIYYSRGLPRGRYDVFRGLAESKSKVYKKHRFALSFENICGIQGYISEKLFDCLRNGTVPVYYGASNIDQFVPEAAYIDYREFGRPSELHDYLDSMDADDYRGYLEAGKRLFDQGLGPFSPEQFAETVTEHLISTVQSPYVKPNVDQSFLTRGDIDRYVHYESDSIMGGLLLLSRTLESWEEIEAKELFKLLRSL